MHGYRQIEHTADIAVEIYADSLENLFRAGVEAWHELSVEGEPAALIGIKNIKLKAASYEELMIIFLSEINYQLHAFKWLSKSIKSITLNKQEKDFFIDADIEGDAIDFDRFTIKEEIKAVTFHQINIENKDDLFTTKIVFDI
ncbi:archease [Bacteroidota bacterium]